MRRVAVEQGAVQKGSGGANTASGGGTKETGDAYERDNGGDRRMRTSDYEVAKNKNFCHCSIYKGSGRNEYKATEGTVNSALPTLPGGTSFKLKVYIDK